MKFPRPCQRPGRLAPAAGLLLALVLLSSCKEAAKPAAPAAKPAAGTNAAAGAKTTAPGAAPAPAAAAETSRVSAYISVFDDKWDAGKDPFYPDSIRRIPIPTKPQPGASDATVHADAVLKLSGIAGSPGRWLAAINNQLLLVGEEADVRVPNGKVHIHVVDLGENYAVVTVDGEPGQKRLTMRPKP